MSTVIVVRTEPGDPTCCVDCHGAIGLLLTLLGETEFIPYVLTSAHPDAGDGAVGVCLACHYTPRTGSRVLVQDNVLIAGPLYNSANV